MTKLEKECSRCKHAKSADAFYFNRRAIDKLNPWCKECVSLYNREYWIANREKQIARKKKYRAENAHKIHLQQKEYVEKNREAVRKVKREYYEANRNRILEYGRNYYFNVQKKKIELERQNAKKDQGMHSVQQKKEG